MSNNQAVLVTGGAGMIGSHIVKKLLKRGLKVIVLDDLSAYPFDYLKVFGIGQLNSVRFVKGSILNKKIVNKLVKEVDCVIHAAAYADVGACIKNYDIDFKVNVEGTYNLLEASLRNKIKKFVFVSSASVYGEGNKKMFSETHPVNPISTYANSKLWGEQETILFSKFYNLPTTALRYFSVYGSPQIPKLGSHSWCVAIFAMLALKGKKITIYGDGNQVRDFTHVLDIAEATVLALQKESTNGFILNVGTGKPTKINDVARKIVSSLNNVPIEYRPYPAGDPLGGYANTILMEKLLNWKPKISLDEGIKEYCEWVKNNRDIIPEWI